MLGQVFAAVGNPITALRAIPPMLRGPLGSGSIGLFDAAMTAPLGERDPIVVARRWVGGAR